jgi:hypothetical protein
VILIESGVRFARPFVTPFNAINETAIRSLCGGKAESSGCLQIKSRLRTSLAKRRTNSAPGEYRMVDDLIMQILNRVAPVIAGFLGARGAGQDRAAP